MICLPEPNPNDSKYKPKFGAIIFTKRNQEQALKKFQEDKEVWESRVQERIENYREINKKLKIRYEQQLEEYKEKLKKLKKRIRESLKQKKRK